MVTYIRSDLDFILNQIKIAEEHSRYVAGDPTARPLFGADGMIPANNISWGLRTVDGTNNNLVPGQEHYGSADQPFPNLLDPDYRPAPETVDMNGPAPRRRRRRRHLRADAEPPRARSWSNSTVRTISNLIVDQSPVNPAAVEKALDLAGIEGRQGTRPSRRSRPRSRCVPAAIAVHDPRRTGSPPCHLQVVVTAHGLEMAGDSLVMPNVSPDEGLSASFNSWFTLFGQFFDHGLDLVAKGQSGTVFIPLQPDDPLYVAGQPDELHGADAGDRRRRGPDA